MSYRLPRIEEVSFTLECESEEIPVRDNALASGDDALDREAEDAIIADFDAGNVWAWCCVHVRAEYRGFIGDDYLGCCSYESEADFVASNDYYDSMKAEAFERLLESMRDAAQRLGCEA